jgi:hypothetical protein
MQGEINGKLAEIQEAQAAMRLHDEKKGIPNAGMPWKCRMG